MSECLFCMIARGAAPSHKVWEDPEHLAFLSIYPNTLGVTVVITKEHYGSYVADLPEKTSAGLFKAACEVAHLLDSQLEDVGRTGIVFEGFGVDHAHAKLFPMHGTGDIPVWRPIRSRVDKFFDQYEGYLSSHDYRKAHDGDLARLARRLHGNS
ncbi:MAG: HIT family protein [Egibacteraceae bacterium]